MDRFKNLLFSPKGMKIVNLLFFLSLLLRNSGIIFIAYIAWIAYLVYGIKITSSKAVKVVNMIFAVFAIVMILINMMLLLGYI